MLADKGFSESKSRMNFIKFTNASFLIASKNATVDSSIQLIIIDSAINKKSGERFYLLQHEK